MISRKLLSIAIVGAVIAIIAAIFIFNNLQYTQEGTAKVVTNWGEIKRVYKPADGWFTTISPGWKAYEVTLRSFTETTTPRVTSKDNAALQVPISVTAATNPNPSDVIEYVRKYGFSEEERHRRRNEILHGLIQTETRNAFSEFGAYEIYANQDLIQKRIVEALRPMADTQLHLVLESVQIGNPDFLDDRIEQAASAVVANEKQKQAEEARFNAAEVAAKTKQIEALTFANPALLDIKKLELQLEIERARAEGIKGHQGALTIMYEGGSRVQLQVPTR
jgi:regulator of protease activity HflC (stomatin/prohibitin superfamily)